MAKAIAALDNFIKEELPTRNKRMPKMTGLLKTILLKRKTAKKKKDLAEWQKHRKAAGAGAMGLAQWLKEGKESVYFKGAGGKKRTVETQLREAGVDPQRFKKKRKK